MNRKSISRWVVRILAAPETNLFLFAFLLNFVYEVWQSPYYEFYRAPSLADKIKDLTHCTFGDGVITLIGSWVVSGLVRSRYWVLKPTRKLTLLFTGVGLVITLVIETGQIATWGVVKESQAIGFDYSHPFEGQSSKHIPFDWKVPS